MLEQLVQELALKRVLLSIVVENETPAKVTVVERKNIQLSMLHLNYINPTRLIQLQTTENSHNPPNILNLCKGNFQETLVHKNLPITPIPPPDDSPEFGTTETTVAVITVIVFCCYRCCWNCCC
jgi:hypothetical protein